MNPHVELLLDQCARYFAQAVAEGDLVKAEQFLLVAFALETFARGVAA